MAQHRGRQREWPTVKREPDTYTLTPDVYARSDRGSAGPLRTGTVPRSSSEGVGPRGRAPQDASDFGMDHIVREFDPMGTALRRYSNDAWESPMISRRPAPRSNKIGSGAGHD